MGYRARLGKANKKYKEVFAGKTCKEVFDMMSDTEAPYYPYFHTQLFELGKYFDTPEHLTEFYDFDMYKEGEVEFSIMSKEGLKLLIQMYHENVLQMYEALAETKEDACKHIEGKVRTWGKYSHAKYGMLPYYLDEPEEKCDGAIVNSWLYEYSIFNLVYIYRTFDWENDYLIYSAW